MILRHDDPLVQPLQALGEPIFLVDSNPTVERIAKLIFDYATAAASGRPRHGLGNADVVCRYRATENCQGLSRWLDPELTYPRLLRVRSRRHAGRLVPRHRRFGQRVLE